MARFSAIPVSCTLSGVVWPRSGIRTAVAGMTGTTSINWLNTNHNSELNVIDYYPLAAIPSTATIQLAIS